MTDNGKGLFCLTLVIMTMVVFWIYARTGPSDTIDSVLSDGYETLGQGLFSPVEDYKVYHCCPERLIDKPTTTRHRYPKYCGHNFSLLIHRGFSPLMESAARNPQWYDNAPQNMGGFSL